MLNFRLRHVAGKPRWLMRLICWCRGRHRWSIVTYLPLSERHCTVCGKYEDMWVVAGVKR